VTSVAEDYWRAACLLSFSHAAGLEWPPPGAPQRRRAAGHWGCNPGIAWTSGHLAAASAGEFLLLVGTGHATSFVFAQQALRRAASAAWISDACRRYSQPGGDPSEALGLPDVPYQGGELGPALGVGQAIAASSPGLKVVTVIGDGECETPAALAAFAHHDVLRPAPGACWLPVINANGARMGSAARFSPGRLSRLLAGLGFTVLHSGPDTASATQAAVRAWDLASAGEPVVWLSVTEKGWPAPEILGGQPFRGPYAHKPGALNLADPRLLADVGKWLSALNDPPVFAADGSPLAAVRRVAERIRLDLPMRDRPGGGSPARAQGALGAAALAPAELAPASAVPAPRPASRPGEAASLAVPTSEMVPASLAVAAPAGACARSPMAVVDDVLAGQSVRVLSPDEASSNRLDQCLAAGLVTEVLAEELCSAWAWGRTEAGSPAAFVSYEAFAPLVATQLAQYAKLISARPPAGRPPFTVVSTSLGWGNSPSHQNSDLVAGLLARAAHCPVRVVFPVGAASAGQRLSELLAERDVLAAITCSKQPMLDLPDPGGTAIGVRMAGATDDDATIVAVGDVAVTEAVAAMTMAAAHGVRVGVIALVEPGRLTPVVRQACRTDLPSVCVSWVAAHHLAAVYWQVRPVPTIHLGYRERWGATAWETLAANGLTRWAQLSALRAAGCPLPPALDQPPEAPPEPLEPGAGQPDAKQWEVRRL
jgi:xylulose-5-phosphate/fructose-6-phosphate phosphoketolase